MNLFVKEGYENVSMRKIAEKINYSPGTIYLHFKDKESILFSLHETAFSKFFEALNKTSNETDSLKRLSEMGKNYIMFALENPEYYDLMFINKCVSESIKREEHKWIGMESYRLLCDTIALCSKDGYIHPEQIEIAAFSMWSFVHGVASLVIKKRLSVIPEKDLDNLINGSVNFITNNLNIKKSV
jgi:AcrR family transcriptional regulator